MSPAPAPAAAFDVAYRDHYDAVRGFLHRLGARGPDLGDLLQETFLTAMRRWATYDPGRPVRPWLMGIAFRTHADFKARAQHRVEAPGMTAEAVAPDDPEQRVSDGQRSQLVARALETLEGTKRAAFLLHYVEGLSPTEVADAMQTPLATTYTRLRSARLELIDAVRRLEGAR